MGTLGMDWIKTAQAETIDLVRPEIRAEGVKEGLEKGVMEGKADMLMDLLNSRFDRLPNWVPDRVASAELGELANWTRAILKAKSVEDVFSSGKDHM